MPELYGPWRVIETIGKGGQGVVHLVVDSKQPGTKYALKALKFNPKDIARTDAARQRFQREKEAMEKLRSPHLVRFIGGDIEGARPYIVMEYVPGLTLEEAVATKILSPERMPALMATFRQICLGIAPLHETKPFIVHQDLKPANIRIGQDGTAVVVDLGALYEDGAERITRIDQEGRGYNFTAPELKEPGQPLVTPAADIYSLGKILYWLCSGGTIFDREDQRDPQRDLTQVTTERVSQPWRMEHVTQVLDKTVNRDPEKRLDIDRLLAEVTILERMFEGPGFNVISPGAPQSCIYCGRGRYVDVTDNSLVNITSTVLTSHMSSSAGWKVNLCNYCGHVAVFYFGKDRNVRGRWEQKPS